jgi:hypothetical protein
MAANQAHTAIPEQPLETGGGFRVAASAVCYAAPSQPYDTYAAHQTQSCAAQAESFSGIRPLDSPENWDEPVRAQTNLLRDIFGNPFRPVILDPAWRTADVLTLARAAYDERPLPAGTLDPARLALLTDALEEAGCSNTDILGHLRSPGPHIRGCWALDLVLGLE